MRRVAKFVLRSLSLLVALPLAAASGFGRLEAVFSFFAHCCAMAPGIPGDYLRVAFYRLTLVECSLASRISFGSFFAHRDATVGSHVYIGSYCIIGRTAIGHHTQIASGVQIVSGSRQHIRNERGEISGAERGVFAPVKIGEHCWIGAAAVIMADVGAGATIGAGSVVSRPIPPGSVAVGSPARVIGATDPGS